MISLISNILEQSWLLLLDVAPFLFLGFFIAGILHVYIGSNLIKKHLGKGDFSSIIKSVLFGIPLPVCSCGVIPIAASLKREGAKKSSILAFLFATPTTGVDSILATYAFLGIIFAVFRPLSALVGGLILGGFALSIKDKENIDFKKIDNTSKKGGILEILNYGFFYLPKEIGKWLIIGVLLGGTITALIPSDFFMRYLSNPWISYPLMLLISIPLYVCATGSIPIAASMIWKGLNPGAALAFLIAGPATNTVTITFVYKELGKKYAALYLSLIAFIATISGLIFDKIWKIAGKNSSILSGGGKFIPLWIKISTSIILLLIILLPQIRIKSKKEKKMKFKLKVSGIQCMGCVDAIKNSINKLNGVEDVVIDLKTKLVLVDGDIEYEKIVKAINDAGYKID
jgi:uncharacterized membrane protein YraQ (UPF0718 family)/copper chaperone CopZ